MKKYVLLSFIVFVLFLSACQNSIKSSSNKNLITTTQKYPDCLDTQDREQYYLCACEGAFDTAEQKDYCYVDMATKLNKIEYCNRVKDKELNDFCINSIKQLGG